ncbi:MAG TPA: hypothetical protein VE621_04105 [Bryobacteraceae bacterium]|nr:hypothetical protein [Bryobacteraceae bacterium]
MFEKICAKVTWCPRQVLDATVELAVEIVREGREGRRPLILDPIALVLFTTEEPPVTSESRA